jgi:hypothetical protein
MIAARGCGAETKNQRFYIMEFHVLRAEITVLL